MTAGARADESVAGGVFQSLGLRPARRTHRRRRDGNRLRHSDCLWPGYTASRLCQLEHFRSATRSELVGALRTLRHQPARSWSYRPATGSSPTISDGQPVARVLTPKALGGARPVVAHLQLKIE